LSRNLTKMSTTELEPRIFEYQTKNDVIAISGNPGTGTTFVLANADGLVLQQFDQLAVLIKSITAAPAQETLEVSSVGDKDSGGAGFVNVEVIRGAVPINIADGTLYSLVWLGNSIAENAAGSLPRSKEPNFTFNFIQLFDKNVGESMDVKNSDFRAKEFFSLNGEMTRERDMLMRNINWAFYLNERKRDLAETGDFRHKTGGIY